MKAWMFSDFSKWWRVHLQLSGELEEDTLKDQLEKYESKKKKQNLTNKTKVQKIKKKHNNEICESPKP